MYLSWFCLAEFDTWSVYFFFHSVLCLTCSGCRVSWERGRSVWRRSIFWWVWKHGWPLWGQFHWQQHWDDTRRRQVKHQSCRFWRSLVEDDIIMSWMTKWYHLLTFIRIKEVKKHNNSFCRASDDLPSLYCGLTDGDRVWYVFMLVEFQEAWFRNLCERYAGVTVACFPSSF